MAVAVHLGSALVIGVVYDLRGQALALAHADHALAGVEQRPQAVDQVLPLAPLAPLVQLAPGDSVDVFEGVR